MKIDVVDEPQLEREANIDCVQAVSVEQIEVVASEKANVEEGVGIWEEVVVDTGLVTENESDNIADDMSKETPEEVLG